MPSPKLPMSCRRKSENGKNLTRSKAGTELLPVCNIGRWQPAQPIFKKTSSPASAWLVIAPRGGGARKVMKSVNACTPEPSSSGSCTKSQAVNTAQFPCGQFSFGNIDDVIPISFKYASAANCFRLGFCPFQPNLPTAERFVATSVTRFGRPAICGVKRFCNSAMLMNTWSGTLSTNPKPKSGVVLRLVWMVASGGTVSPEMLQDASICPMPCDWISDPPN